jgi:hypothetical protein
MQGGREEFHYQVFSLVTDREVLKKFEKSSHVRLRTIFIIAIKMREENPHNEEAFFWDIQGFHSYLKVYSFLGPIVKSLLASSSVESPDSFLETTKE